MQSTGALYIIAAASGTGKTSLARALEQTLGNIKISISHTTRPMRIGEIADQSYFFVTPAEFQRMIAQQAFLEYAQVFADHYGTSRAFVDQQLQRGMDVLLDIDWQGAMQIKKLYPESVSIFLLPPSRAELQQRLQLRKREDAQIIAHRMSLASSEIQHCAEFDYIVINDDFARALQELQTIITANRLRTSKQLVTHAQLLEELTKE